MLNLFMIQGESKLDLNFWLFIVLIVIILFSLWAGLGVSWEINKFLNEKIAKAEEIARPANLDLIILKESSCEDCFDIERLINEIKQKNVKINSEKFLEVTSLEGRELIEKYNITQVPTFIVTGELEKDSALKTLWPQIGEVKDNTFIFRQTGAPYILVASGEIRGRGEFIMLSDTSCSECYDVTRHEAVLQSFGFNQKGRAVDRQSKEGKELIRKYKIKLLPTLILTGDIEAYPALKGVWPQVGTIEKDGTYIFREGVKQMGVYKDSTTNKIIKPEGEKK